MTASGVHPHESSAADRFAVESLLSAYAVSLDLQDTDATAALFTDDGVFRVRGLEFAGHAELRSFFAGAQLGMHLCGRAVVTTMPEGVAVRSQLVFQPADRTPHRLALYDDLVVPVDGGWRFRSRNCQFMDRHGRWGPMR